MKRDDEGRPMTRELDPPDGSERIEHARREGRLRTLFYSVLVSGVVSLAVVRLGEVQNFNDQQTRNRVNCGLLQDDRRDRIDQLTDGADQILGAPKKNIPTADFSKPPYAAFKSFKTLIVANAMRDRNRADEIERRIENCNLVFPKRRTFPIIG